MRKLYTILLLCFATFVGCNNAFSQVDSTLQTLSSVPTKYISTIDKKVNAYSRQVSSKTIKTLRRLGKWELKIKATLDKLFPETSQQLFGNNQLTFASLLLKIQKGEAIKLDYSRQYDKYIDDAITSLKYIEKNREYVDSGLAKRVGSTKEKLEKLNDKFDSADAIKVFIQQRKKQIIKAAFAGLGNNKWLVKIDKETWYYAETLNNYKELFSDEAKVEIFVKDALRKVPGFSQFVQKNSMLASLFGATGDVEGAAPIVGLQTRAAIQNIIELRIASGGAAAGQAVKKNLQAAQAQLSQYKDKLLKQALGGTVNGEAGMQPFKPNTQKTKTFLQRLEFGFNIQFTKNNSLIPTTMDAALTAGYKLNDKSTAGIGAGYKMGMGSIDKIRFSTEGISLRSFIDWKLKRQFFVSGGWEMNYLNRTIQQGSLKPAWQQSALAGISKKFSIKTKWAKQTQLQLLHDFMAKKNLSQQWLFRIGYSF